MTHYEEAEKLINEFMNIGISKELAKQCALITIAKINKTVDWHDYDAPSKEWRYWEEVKKELNKF